MFDVVTFGSASLDIFLSPERFSVQRCLRKKKLSFPFGVKNNLSGIHYATGGGGTNVAVGLSLQGLRTAYCGMIGKDFAGREVVKDLERYNVDTQFLQFSSVATNISIIFSVDKDRTAFVWKEASKNLLRENVPWKKMETAWYYFAPLAGELGKELEDIITVAQGSGKKVMVNPGRKQIIEKSNFLIADVLLLNQEEASLLTGKKLEKDILKKMREMTDSLVLITKGKKGVVAVQQNNIWRAPSLDVSVVEKTGAGDAFASGFLSHFSSSFSVHDSIQMGIANSVNCISRWGAKKGLLKKGDKWEKIHVQKDEIK